jgi:type IV pilus assembly protein PilY1
MTESKMKKTARLLKAVALLGSMAASSISAQAAISLSETPLFLSVNVAPNVILTLDDSGSMAWGFMPDSKYFDYFPNGINPLKRFTSYPWNAQYYDPNTTYAIPTRTDGVSYNTSFTAARVNGFDSSKFSVNLSNSYQTLVTCNTDGTSCSSFEWPTAAYYHLYYADKPSQSKPNNCNATREDEDCYVKVTVGSSDDIFSGTTAQKQQNFANWYSFYRSRALATMSAAMNAVTSLDTDQVRLAWHTLNNGGCNSFGTSCKGYDNVEHENRMRTLDALKNGSSTTTHRTDFYNWVQRFQVGSGTPLRSALQRSGTYYTSSGVNSPYAEEPYTTLGEELSCRKNFNIVFTDGYWNSDAALNSDANNIDSTGTPLPDGKAYTSRAPYQDANHSSLADYAFYYWSTDLRTDQDDEVPEYIVDRSGTATEQYWNPKNDPATWQHMVNFTIGLGLGSVLTNPAWGGDTYSGDYADLVSGNTSWPATGADAEGNVYDLWHAALNSRGQFFSADNPAAVSAAFQSVFDSILTATPSAAALAANSTSIQTGTMVYQARFDSSDWHGQLLAYSVNADGSIGNEQWDASELIPAHGSRNIYTWNGSTGKTFSNCNSSLSTAQKLALNTNSSGTVDSLCSTRLAWLRGDASNEARNGGAFRNRTVSVLGDVVNSDPAYVQTEDYGYASAGFSEKNSYAAFVTGKASRTPMIYVGANDGMLHAFRADTGNTASGKEFFAYIPAGVYDKLSRLTDTAYDHTYYVDGPPNSGDAYWSGSWKTVLVGGLGAGGKSVYALDVSDPAGFGASDILWEYADAADLGYTYSQPQIARLANGEWAAVFGNGYNSSSDQAFLYIVKLSDGTLIKKIAAGSATANGLSTPVLYDADSDGVTDAVYAGDLRGNLWKFDLSSTAASGWTIGNGGDPLFTATNDDDETQPITSQPAVGGHSSGGVLVYFGTGRYLTSTDPSDTSVQSFYAIWDNDSSDTTSRSQLQQQTITAETTEFGFEVRETSNNTVDWAGGKRGWYMDLLPPSATASGERVVSRPLLKYDRVIFVTVLPSSDQCTAGGSSWIMELELITGGRTTLSAFDFDGDGDFDAGDALASGNVGSGVKSKVGITKTPTWLGGSNGKDFKELSGTSGGIMSLGNRGATTSGTVERVFWQQIQ